MRTLPFRLLIRTEDVSFKERGTWVVMREHVLSSDTAGMLWTHAVLTTSLIKAEEGQGVAETE